MLLHARRQGGPHRPQVSGDLWARGRSPLRNSPARYSRSPRLVYPSSRCCDLRFRETWGRVQPGSRSLQAPVRFRAACPWLFHACLSASKRHAGDMVGSLRKVRQRTVPSTRRLRAKSRTDGYPFPLFRELREPSRTHLIRCHPEKEELSLASALPTPDPTPLAQASDPSRAPSRTPPRRRGE